MKSSSNHEWSPGDYLTHRSNPELGIGRVTSRNARSIDVEFPRSGTRLRMAASTDALEPVLLVAGRPVRINATREEGVIGRGLGDGSVQLTDGRIFAPDALWPLELEGALLDRLALGEVDDVADFVTRLGILRLLEMREAGGLGSFLGGRIRLFPHQLYVAGRATATDPVRWLLADEVGLGKTIEACLILNKLVHTGRVERCLIVVPDALSVQWLGELWRKYHQVFTILDAPRLADVARDFGDDFNPFDVHRRAVIALETLIERPHLTTQAVRAGIDLLVVDEAQHLRRPPGHPGDPGWRAVAPIAALGRHVLLLSATPLEDDAHGFFRLLQLLRPEEFPEETSFDDRLADSAPLPPCTSSTRRIDIGGLPPRIGIAVDLGNGPEMQRWAGLQQRLRESAAPNIVVRRRKGDRIRRALSSGAALGAVLSPEERELRHEAAALDANDPRIAWLVTQAPRWREAGEKTLIFVAYRETLEMVRTALSNRVQLATGVFHEDLSPARRDTEVARFREDAGPSLLVSTECGGEGRNFEFCRRLILFDMPWQPTTVEQRIGRLDRIGRQRPVEIVYFAPADGIVSNVVRLFDALGIFREPLAGLEPQLARISDALEDMAMDPRGSLSDERLRTFLADAQAARTRIHEAAYHELHRDPYRPEMAQGLLSRVPADLDDTNERTVVTACERLGIGVEQRHRGRHAYSVELGSAALVDSLPGVPGGSTFVGTFDREEAVANEDIDFFASGHPLVEGVFAHFDEGGPGRVAHFEATFREESGEGLIVVFKDRNGLDIVAFDASGRSRPDWSGALHDGRMSPRRARRASVDRERWASLVRRLAVRLEPGRRPHAVATVTIKPA